MWWLARVVERERSLCNDESGSYLPNTGEQSEGCWFGRTDRVRLVLIAFLAAKDILLPGLLEACREVEQCSEKPAPNNII